MVGELSLALLIHSNKGTTSWCGTWVQQQIAIQRKIDHEHCSMQNKATLFYLAHKYLRANLIDINSIAQQRRTLEETESITVHRKKNSIHSQKKT